MFVAVARVSLQISEAKSLKDKRQVLRKVMDRLKSRFNVSVAEVDDNDVWHKATIGLSVVGNDRRHVNEQIDKCLHFVEEMYVAPVISRELEIVSFGEGMASLQAEDAFAIPKGDRSLAEAEGIAWEDRYTADSEDDGPEGGQSRELTLDEARSRARSLRNPREWEKK